MFLRMKYFYIIILAIGVMGCEEEQKSPIVITEDVLYLSGEIVKLSGRIYDNGGSPVSEHGFEISTSENFDSDVTTLKLGSTNNIGQFIGSDSALVNGEEYSYRAYMVSNENIVYGKVKGFQTLSPRIKNFSPQLAREGDVMTIVGANLSSSTKIYFGDVEAPISNILLESIITVEIPKMQQNKVVDIRVLIDGEFNSFQTPFEYIVGEWKKVGTFVDNTNFFNGFHFYNDEELLFGLGDIPGDISNERIWKLKFDTWQWEEVLNFPGTKLGGPFYNNSGILGSGAIFREGLFTPNNQMWEYKNGVFNSIGNTPLLYKSVLFEIGDTYYVTGGLLIKAADNASENKVIFKYNSVTNKWAEYGIMPFNFDSELITFTYDENQYFITKDADLWSYSPSLNIWTRLNQAPFKRSTSGFAEVVDQKIFVGVVRQERELWEYNPENDTWKPKIDFPGNATFYSSAHFSYNSKIYLIRGNPLDATLEFPMEIWEFDPEKL